MSTEERLARLEGKSTAAMALLSEIAIDYSQLKGLLFDSQVALRDARFRKMRAIRALKEARDEYELEEASLLAVDERAVGKNAEERKNNAAFVIREERKPGGKLHGLWETYYNAQVEAEESETDEAAKVDYFSAVRYASRMAAGFAYALGG